MKREWVTNEIPHVHHDSILGLNPLKAQKSKIFQSETKMIQSEIKIIRTEVKMVHSQIKMFQSEIKIIQSEIQMSLPRLIHQIVHLPDLDTGEGHISN